MGTTGMRDGNTAGTRRRLPGGWPPPWMRGRRAGPTRCSSDSTRTKTPQGFGDWRVSAAWVAGACYPFSPSGEVKYSGAVDHSACAGAGCVTVCVGPRSPGAGGKVGTLAGLSVGGFDRTRCTRRECMRTCRTRRARRSANARCSGTGVVGRNLHSRRSSGLRCTSLIWLP